MNGGSGPAEVADEERGKTGQGRAGGRAWRWVGSRRCWRRGPGAEGKGCFLERRQELGADCEVRNSPQDRSHF